MALGVKYTEDFLEHGTLLDNGIAAGPGGGLGTKGRFEPRIQRKCLDGA